MKKRIFIQVAGIFLLISLFAACKKWVDYDPHDDYQITDLDYLKTEADYRTMAVSVYTPLQWLNQIIPIGDIASDNSVSGGESASDQPDLQQMDDYTILPTNGALKDLWQSAYEGVNRANYLIQYKTTNKAGETVDFAGKEALYGELYFLRAYYYFTLVKLFGDVPLFTDKRLSLTESKTLQRSPKADVYKQIETDLNSAIGVLPSIQTQKGRITKYAAQAMLGKVYLYQNKFDEAASMLENVISSNAFTLDTSYAHIFLASGENGSESVFEIQYTNTAPPYYNWDAPTRGQGSLAVQQNGIRDLKGSSPYAPGWSTDLPTQNLASAFTAGDKRKDVTILDIDAYIIANPSLFFDVSANKPFYPSTDPKFSEHPAYLIAPYRNTGLYNQKYLPRVGETSGQVEFGWLNNFRAIRYADVLLMAAEANNRSATHNDTKAQDYINRVRKRAFGNDLHKITSNGDALKNDIWNERRLELGMEGDRFFDLVRTGQAHDKITGFVVGKNEVFPIPQTEIDISKLTQNPGY